MRNRLLAKLYSELKKKAYDAYFLDISNENLYEFVDAKDNLVMKLTGFTGDTGLLLVLKNRSILYVDGRFTIQAKKEIKDRSIKVVKLNSRSNIYKDIKSRIKKNGILAFDPKIESIKTIKCIEKEFEDKNIVLKCDYSIVDGIKNNKLEEDQFEREALFVLDRRYVSKPSKKKITEVLFDIKNLGFTHYITSSLEEIAYLTNLRKKPTIGKTNVLPKAFMIIGVKKSYIYTDDILSKKAKIYFSKNNIAILPYDMFYSDLTKIKNEKFALDQSLNNYYAYKKLSLKGDKASIISPLIMPMSIKGKNERKALLKCNIIDGVAITKAIYHIKNMVMNGDKISEYEAKHIVDSYREEIGKNLYLSPSFDTIVAYKENSAICHYSPSERSSKNIKKGSLLLIDSGGNYVCGTTDITRTVSLYKRKAPRKIRKHYTMVLNSLMSLAMQVFPYGILGSSLDIVARQNLYNEYLDYDHGTGHGIGYISNVHEGPNRISPNVNIDKKLNIIRIGQVMSDEPGLYFEGKYGIRLENDIMSIKDRENKYGTFIKFMHLTISPFDRDLIDEKILDKKIIKELNSYNKMVYRKLHKFMNADERKKLRYDTKPFKERKEV